MQCYGENIAFDDKDGSNKNKVNEDLSNDDTFSFIVLYYVNYFLAMFWQKVFIYLKH